MGRSRQNGYRRWRWAHGVLGLLAGIPLVIQGLTGALLSYEREVRNRLGDGPMAGERAEMATLLTAFGGEKEGAAKWIIYFEDPREPAWIRWAEAEGREVSYLVNPGTGEVLEGSTRWHRRYETILGVHRRLGVGRTGEVVMGGSALLLAGLLVSGLVLQVRRSRDVWAMLGRGRRKGRFWLWLHGTLGTWMTPFLLLLALTGPVWTFAGYRALIGWATQSEMTTYAAPGVSVEKEARPDLEAILAGAATIDPGDGAKRLILPPGPGKAARFEWAPENAPFENFRTRAWLHPSSGEILRMDPLESYTAADRAVRWAYPLHTGNWGGEATRLLHFLAALSVPLFVCTGGWLYWKRTNP